MSFYHFISFELTFTPFHSSFHTIIQIKQFLSSQLVYISDLGSEWYIYVGLVHTQSDHVAEDMHWCFLLDSFIDLGTFIIYYEIKLINLLMY